MRSAWILRVLFRRSRVAVASFVALLALGLAVALLAPLRYESQVIIERRPQQLSPQLSTQERSTEFELSRLTSETQRTVALLRSPAMMEAWAAELGMKFGDARKKEDALKKLGDALAVRPINYTDDYILRAKARSPSEAQHRAQAIADTFIKWDTNHNEQQAQELTDLLNRHLSEVRQRLNGELVQLRQLKTSQSATLIGSSAQQELQAEIQAQQALYTQLTGELEGAERRKEGFGRTQILTGPSTSVEPLMSRARLVALALCVAFLGALFFVFIAEWQDDAIYRAQDIARELPRVPVLTLPASAPGREDIDGPMHLRPLSDAIMAIARTKGSATIQIATLEPGPERTPVASSLAKMLGPWFHVAVLSRSLAPAPPVAGVPAVTIPAGPTEKTPREPAPDVTILELPTVPGTLPGANLRPEADLSCIVVSAGRTSRHLLRPLAQQLDRLPAQTCVLVLSHYRDPLPVRFQR